jgi:hypothetical protein
MWSCECCGERREDVKVNDCGVMLCEDCERLYSEDPEDYFSLENVSDEYEPFRAEGW